MAPIIKARCSASQLSPACSKTGCGTSKLIAHQPRIAVQLGSYAVLASNAKLMRGV